MRLVRRNGDSMEDVVTRALHLRLRLRFASLILIMASSMDPDIGVVGWGRDVSHVAGMNLLSMYNRAP